MSHKRVQLKSEDFPWFHRIFERNCCCFTGFHYLFDLAAFEDVDEMVQREVVAPASTLTAQRAHRIGDGLAVLGHVHLHVLDVTRTVVAHWPRFKFESSFPTFERASGEEAVPVFGLARHTFRSKSSPK